jgi:hypothetical protein
MGALFEFTEILRIYAPDGALPVPPNEPSWRSGPGCFRSGPFASLATEVGRLKGRVR